MYTETLSLWLRYVDDTITAVHENEIDELHEHLNNQNSSIQFTKEIEENGKIHFLDCLVTRESNTLRTTVYRKQHTLTEYLTKRLTILFRFTQSDYDTNLDENSTSCLRLRRLFDRRNQALDHCFTNSNCNIAFIQRNTCIRPNDSSNDIIHHNSHYTSHTRDLQNHNMLRPYNIRVAHKPMFTSRHLLTNVKGRDKLNLKTDQEHFIRSNAPTSGPLILVSPAET